LWSLLWDRSFHSRAGELQSSGWGRITSLQAARTVGEQLLHSLSKDSSIFRLYNLSPGSENLLNMAQNIVHDEYMFSVRR